MQRNHVDIAFHQDDVIQFGLFRKIQAKQILSLIENNGFRRVQILGRIIIFFDDTAAKADHIAPDIDDGEHESVTKTIEQIAVFLGYRHKTGLPQFFVGIPLGTHSFHQGIPAIRGIAHTEGSEDRFGHSTAQSIIQGILSDGRIQLAMEEASRLLMQRPKALLLAVAGLILLILRNGHTHTLRQGTNRIGIRKSLHFHLEVDDAATFMATETIIDSLIGIDREGSGLFAMEGTKSKHIRTAALQANILTHHILNGIALNQFIDK